jgi:acetoacetyl-CoA synthetase
MEVSEGSLLWEPSPPIKEQANLTRYMAWLKENYGLTFKTYPELWQWSVTDLERFWETIWAYFEVKSSKKYNTVLAERKMPGARWFAGAELNYAENLFQNMTGERPALLYKAENEPLVELSWQELYDKTRLIAHALKQMGVKRGDRVVAYMPHMPETVAALLACASLGAIWSSCSPDFGGPSVLDRFSQIEPKILITVDGYPWNGKMFDRRDVVAQLQASLPTLKRTILVNRIIDGSDLTDLQNTILWHELLDTTQAPAGLEFEQLPFDHPLWVLYSSGTTGLPKPIVQGHGGIILEHLKVLGLHMDLKPEDRFFWYTSTGWMMWNFLIGGLLLGSPIIIYNGSPGYPSMEALWELAEASGMTYFGTSAAYISACIKAGIRPNERYDLNRIKAVGSTGSPLSLAGFRWIYENVNRDLALESFSGGTDLCTGFVGGCRLLPIYAGEIQGATLGARVLAFNETGESVVNEVGELVIAEPMPSMPLYFWNDPNNQRYLESYFEMYPGIWRHGDWIKFNQRGGCIIYGRSDSTINRQGVRMGTSEIYQVVESLPEILDSLVIDLELLDRESYMPLFVVLAEGVELDKALKQKIKQKIRQDISPRHIPNDIFAIEQVPYTLSGKKMEVPIRKILLGQPVEKAANPGAMRNPEALRFFVDLAQKQTKIGS